MPEGTRAIVGTNHNGCPWRKTCVFKHTSKADEDNTGNVVFATKLEEAKELDCVLKDGQGSTLSIRSILKKTGWHQQIDNSHPILSQRGKTLPHKRKKRTFTGYNSVETQK